MVKEICPTMLSPIYMIKHLFPVIIIKLKSNRAYYILILHSLEETNSDNLLSRFYFALSIVELSVIQSD